MMAIMMWFNWIEISKGHGLETRLIHHAMVKQAGERKRARASACLRGRY